MNVSRNKIINCKIYLMILMMKYLYNDEMANTDGNTFLV